jgi:hypothetical protein
MKLYFLSITLVLAFVSGLAAAQSASVDVGLTPAGSFKVKSTEVRGYVQLKDGSVTGKNIMVGLKNLQTGISLRDTHTKKHLEVEKYPTAILVSATGKDGNGTGLIRIKGIQKKIAGTYKIDGSTLIAVFPIKLSDFNIVDIKYMGVGVDDEAKVTVSVPVKK